MYVWTIRIQNLFKELISETYLNMAFSALRMTTIPPTQLSVRKSSDDVLSIATTRLQPLNKVRCKADSEPEVPKSLSLSRRDAIICLTTFSCAGIGISHPDIAEARIKRDEIRRKFKKKLEMLREKAGFSKQKENDKGKSSSKSPSTKTLPLEPSPLPLPSPPQGLEKSLVEATYGN